jgi:hypothetical protein
MGQCIGICFGPSNFGYLVFVMSFSLLSMQKRAKQKTIRYVGNVANLSNKPILTHTLKME